MSIAQVFRHLLSLHHGGAPLGQRCFLAGLRRKLVELVNRMAQPVALAFGAVDLGSMRIRCGLRFSPRLPMSFDLCCRPVESAKSVEKAAMGCRIDQCALIVLAMNLDKCVAEL